MKNQTKVKKKLTVFQSSSYASRRLTNPLTSSGFLWLQAPATTSIITQSQSTADADVLASYQSFICVPILERGPGDCACLHDAVAHRAASQT